MNTSSLWLLSPELSLAVVAGVALLVDLVTRRKGIVGAVALAGLLLPLLFTVLLWGELAGWMHVLAPQPGEQAGEAIPGIHGTLVVDRYALFFKLLVFGALGLVIMAAQDYRGKLGKLQGEFYCLLLISAGGMSLLAATRELMSLYLALELATLPLAAFLRNGPSLEAGIKFLLLGGVSSGIFLFEMALAFGATGSTYLVDIGSAVALGTTGGDLPFGSYALLAGAVMMTAGFAFKIAVVPFQMWAPDVYHGAPTPVTAYLSIASKAAGVAALLRVFSTAFGAARNGLEHLVRRAGCGLHDRWQPGGDPADGCEADAGVQHDCARGVHAGWALPPWRGARRTARRWGLRGCCSTWARTALPTWRRSLRSLRLPTGPAVTRSAAWRAWDGARRCSPSSLPSASSL
ncbi:MAG: hypothetical protein EXR48_03975 [Dehalococcoidia bacterium]|nr:hypothetical protein [Dehalococcoidia bacterium]